jgi:hypothetical protein
MTTEFVQTSVKCPFCGTNMERALNRFPLAKHWGNFYCPRCIAGSFYWHELREFRPRECFVIDHGYVDIFCDQYMAEDYYRKAKNRLCTECYWYFDDLSKPRTCQKPFGRMHLFSIVKQFLWRLRWKFPPLAWLYSYRYRLTRRRRSD